MDIKNLICRIKMRQNLQSMLVYVRKVNDYILQLRHLRSIFIYLHLSVLIDKISFYWYNDFTIRLDVRHVKTFLHRKIPTNLVHGKIAVIFQSRLDKFITFIET